MHILGEVVIDRASGRVRKALAEYLIQPTDVEPFEATRIAALEKRADAGFSALLHRPVPTASGNGIACRQGRIEPALISALRRTGVEEKRAMLSEVVS